MGWWLKAWRNYAVFGGRARRKEYWYFLLFNAIALSLCTALDFGLGTDNPSGRAGLIAGVFSLASLVPAIAVGVRRMHDTNRSGWYLLLGLIPVLGAIALIIMMLQDSYPSTNSYGPNPKTMS